MTKAAGDNEKAQEIVKLTSELDTIRSQLQDKEKSYHELEQKFQNVDAEHSKLKQVRSLKHVIRAVRVFSSDVIFRNTRRLSRVCSKRSKNVMLNW
jgi:chromosome segregation ATPase